MLKLTKANTKSSTFLAVCLLIGVALILIGICHLEATDTTEQAKTENNKSGKTKVPKARDTQSVDPSVHEHGVYVTDGEHAQEPSFKVHTEKPDSDHPSSLNTKYENHQTPINDQINVNRNNQDEKAQQQSNPINNHHHHHKKQQKRAIPSDAHNRGESHGLKRTNSFRSINGIWNELNDEFKTVSSRMNKMFSNFFKDEEREEPLGFGLGSSRWKAFNKVFDDYHHQLFGETQSKHQNDDVDDEFSFLDSFWKRRFNHQLRHKKPSLKRNYNDELDKRRHFLSPLNRLYSDLFDHDNTNTKSPVPSSNHRNDRQQQLQKQTHKNKLMFNGGITEGSKGYQVQLEIPSHLEKSDVKISIQKINDHVSLLKVKSEKKIEKKIEGKPNKMIRGEAADASNEKQLEKNTGTTTNSEEKQNSKKSMKFYQSFQRIFTIYKPIIKEKVEAKLENGILNVFLPKDVNSKEKPNSEYNVNIL